MFKQWNKYYINIALNLHMAAHLFHPWLNSMCFLLNLVQILSIVLALTQPRVASTLISTFSTFHE